MRNIILKNIVRFLFCISLVFASIKIVAQGDNKPSSYFPSIAPATPNSASLGLYGQVPISLFTGNANVSIPLLEIKSNNLTMPISLSYSSDGIKVDQYESNVGMGWALNAGGVITRQVFDIPENYQGRLQKPNATQNSNEMTNFLEQASDAPNTDTQPDIFSYNVNGLSGKFVLDDANIPVEIEPSGLKIEITPEFLNGGSDTNPEIIITDTKGIKYYFGGLNANESSSSRRIFAEAPVENPISDDVVTSWYLTKIEDPSANSQITLSYDSRNITYITGNEQNLEYYYTSSMPSATGAYLYNYQIKSYSTESLLKEINTNNGKVSFVYSKRFSDSNFPLSKVDEIKYTTTEGTLIKNIKLDYDEYSGNTFANQYNQDFAYFSKRFFLKQINEYSTNINPITHQFEYYSPEKLPARFSFAQDTYGVFNGKVNSSLILDEVGVPNSILYRVFSDSKCANRRPDKYFGYYGLLKKITYPTKGNTILEYEPHVKGKKNLPILPAKTAFNLDVSTNNVEDENLFNNSNTAVVHSSIEQTIRILGNVRMNCPPENDRWLLATVEIKDLSTNTLISFWQKGANVDYPILIGTSYTLRSTESISEDTFTLEANKDYAITIKLIRPCLFANVFFNYYTGPITFQEIENEIGGFRIGKIIKDNSINGKLEKEKYYYSPYNCLICQSGFYISQAPQAYIKIIERNNRCDYPANRTLYSVGSSNMARIYSAQNVQFGYEYVTKSYGDNFENGGEETKYEIVQDGLPVFKQGFEDKTTPFTNGFGAGKVLTNKVFNSTFKVIKETVNHYHHDISKDKSFTGYNVYLSEQNYNSNMGSSGMTCRLEINSTFFSLSEYYIRSQWHYLNQSIEKQFDLNGLNPITTTTDYNYNNPAHVQLTSQVTTNSKNETMETKYYYPPDLIAEPFMPDLVEANRIGLPISTEQYKAGTLISKNKTVYANDGTTANLLLPNSIYAAKFPNNLPNLTTLGQLEKKVTYDQYDNKGNILQYTPENGTPIALIWGYNQTRVVAKLENIALADIPAELITAIQNVSDAPTSTESQVIGVLNALRTSTDVNLQKAMITTYTHIPLVGVSTITDPKGDTIIYTYDPLGRLKFVKDKNGNLLSENEYHYRE